MFCGVFGVRSLVVVTTDSAASLVLTASVVLGGLSFFVGPSECGTTNPVVLCDRGARCGQRGKRLVWRSSKLNCWSGCGIWRLGIFGQAKDCTIEHRWSQAPISGMTRLPAKEDYGHSNNAGIARSSCPGSCRMDSEIFLRETAC